MSRGYALPVGQRYTAFRRQSILEIYRVRLYSIWRDHPAIMGWQVLNLGGGEVYSTPAQKAVNGRRDYEPRPQPFHIITDPTARSITPGAGFQLRNSNLVGVQLLYLDIHLGTDIPPRKDSPLPPPIVTHYQTGHHFIFSATQITPARMRWPPMRSATPLGGVRCGG
jgi:hypothetical protein